tara:strand:- start:15 stop:578 length:564 start_codon:yes stop_codon:yes gene_type:complete
MFSSILLSLNLNLVDGTGGEIWPILILFFLFVIGLPLLLIWITASVAYNVQESLLKAASNGDSNDLHDTLGPEDKFSKKDPITNRWVHEDSIEWIDIACKDNKKIYDPNGDIIVIGHPISKIHTMATYDINGILIEDSSIKVKKVAKKVIFMDPNDKKDEKGKLKKLYVEGYISKSKYNSLMRDLNK